MSSKRRGGRRSSSFASQGGTPAGGVPAPGITQALAAMAAQLEAFANEVKDLKAILSDVAPRGPSASPHEPTFDMDLAQFKRLRNLRLTLCVAVPLLLAAGVALWLSFKARPVTDSLPQRQTTRVGAPTIAAPSTATMAVPQDAAQPARAAGRAGVAESEGGPSTSEKHAARPAALHKPARTSSMSVGNPAKGPVSADRHTWSSSPLPDRAAPELSGGAPILD